VSSPETQSSPDNNDPASAGTRTTKVFHNPPLPPKRDTVREKNDPRQNDAGSSPSSSIANFGAATPLLDPSTNTNPLQDDTDIWGLQAHQPVLGSLEDEKSQAAQAHEKSRTVNFRDVSKHTFYIVNSQMRLKLFAKSNVSNFQLSLGIAYCYFTRDKCSNLSQHSRKLRQLHRILEAIGLAAFHPSG